MWPAMVAAVCDPKGQLVAVHRTWLEERDLAFEETPLVGKAPFVEPKRTLDHYRGGCIRLWRGLSRRPWGQMPADEALVIGEGIEDVLSCVQRWPTFRAACAISLSAMLSAELPSSVTKLFLVRQSDAPNSKAALLFKRVVKRFLDQGRRVFILNYCGASGDLNEYSQLRAAMGVGEWQRSNSPTK
jgi:hypothetical protein